MPPRVPSRRHLLSSSFFFGNFSLRDYDAYNYSELDFEGLFEPELELCASFIDYLNFFHVYYIPLIIAVGLIGNLLSCVVFLTTHLRMRSSSYYLAALSVADLGFLSVLLVVHFSFNGITEIYNRNGWCQTFVYISTVCSTLSVWLIVAFTVERFIAVQYPLQRPHICTVTRAKAVVSVLSLVALTSQSYIFWIAGIIDIHGVAECEMIPDYHDFMKIINFVDTLVTLIGPVILIVTMNAMIARNLLLFRKRFQNGSLDECLCSEQMGTELHRTQTQSGCSNQKTGSQHSKHSNNSLKSIRKSKMGKLPKTIHIKSSAKNNTLSTRNQQNITKMLLLISSVFILLNLPSYAIRLTVYFVYALWQKTPPEMLWCVQQFAMLLFYTNFSINFLLYSMCGITFRRCLWQLMRNKLKNLTRRPCLFQYNMSDNNLLNSSTDMLGNHGSR